MREKGIARGEPARRTRLLFGTTLASASLLLSILVVELGLRAAGYQPWQVRGGVSVEPTLHDPDPQLGWILRPGHWRYGPDVPGGSMVEVTIGIDRSRWTRSDADADPGSPRPRVVLLGDSFTFGWGVSDEETWAWRFQALRPELEVRNHATGAYGTFQALLLLERLLTERERPAHVIYAFNVHQVPRNVLNPGWLRALALLSRQNIVAVPYCTLDAAGRLVRYGPESYPAWPLRESSAAVTLLQDAWFEFWASLHRTDPDEVTRQLVGAMAERCRAAGTGFSLVLLLVGTAARDTIVPFALAQGIDTIDCDRPFTVADRVPGDLHPNGRFHAGWGECVARGFRTVTESQREIR